MKPVQSASAGRASAGRRQADHRRRQCVTPKPAASAAVAGAAGFSSGLSSQDAAMSGMRGDCRHGDCANPDPQRRCVADSPRTEIGCHSRHTFGIEPGRTGCHHDISSRHSDRHSGWSYDHWVAYGHGHAVQRPDPWADLMDSQLSSRRRLVSQWRPDRRSRMVTSHATRRRGRGRRRRRPRGRSARPPATICSRRWGGPAAPASRQLRHLTQ